MKVLIPVDNLTFHNTARGVQRVAVEVAWSLNAQVGCDVYVAIRVRAILGVLYVEYLPYEKYQQCLCTLTDKKSLKWKFMYCIFDKINTPKIKNFFNFLAKSSSIKGAYRKLRKKFSLSELLYQKCDISDVDNFDYMLSFEFAEKIWDTPLIFCKKIKKVLFIHDVIFAKMDQNEKNLMYQDINVFMGAVNNADMFIYNSKSTKNDFEQLVQARHKRGYIAYLGVKGGTVPEHTSTANKFRILMIGSLDQRKNITRALEAVRVFKVTYNVEVVFTIVGDLTHCKNALKEFDMSNLGVEIHFPGRLPDDQIEFFYQNSDVLLYPSLWEGFGLPILEAYRYGLPVITSCLSSMPEVGGDFALYVDPYDINEIANALHSVAQMTEAERSIYAAKARLHAKEFTWEKCAAEIYVALNNELQRGNGSEIGKNKIKSDA